MIDFFFGKPRTGKTYRAVDLIYKEYIKPNSIPTFDNILTNIGGFKFKEVNQIFLDKGSVSRAYKLEWKTFYIHLKKLHEMALDEKSDDELNKYANYHHINNALIVLDEASFYMKRYDDAISWWLAYHGHFKMRIICITQSPKQIYSEYMEHTEIFYEAQPQAKQLSNKSLRYIHYSDIPFKKDNRFGNSSLKTSQDIYNLYKSGEVDKPKKIIYKFIFMAIFAIVAVFALGYFFVHKVKTEAHIEDVPQKQVNSNNDDYKLSDIDNNLVRIRCDNKYCWNTDSKYESNEVTMSYFKYVILKNNINLAYFEVANEIYRLIPLSKGQQKVTLASLTDYYYSFNQSVKDKYLKQLFILKKRELKNNINIDNPFDDNNNKEKVKK